MNKWLKVGLILLHSLLLLLIINLYTLGLRVSSVDARVSGLEREQAVAWFRQMIFEARVRGLDNNALVFFGHRGEAGEYFTIGEMQDYSGVGPYDANTYVNVPIGEELRICLREKGGTVIAETTLSNIGAGDLLIAWYDPDSGSAQDVVSPDEWSLPAFFRTGEGILVAIERFNGQVE